MDIAQELVGGGELGADARGLAPRRLGRDLGLAAGAASSFGGGIRLAERRPARGDILVERAGALLGLRTRGLERRQLAIELGLLVARQSLELGLQLPDALQARLVG